MKYVSNQQVIDHFKRLNPWWMGTEKDEGVAMLRPRAYLDPVRQLLLESGLRRAVVLLGPRRVGKTVLIPGPDRPQLSNCYTAALDIFYAFFKFAGLQFIFTKKNNLLLKKISLARPL